MGDFVCVYIYMCVCVCVLKDNIHTREFPECHIEESH